MGFLFLAEPEQARALLFFRHPRNGFGSSRLARRLLFTEHGGEASTQLRVSLPAFRRQVGFAPVQTTPPHIWQDQDPAGGCGQTPIHQPVAVVDCQMKAMWRVAVIVLRAEAHVGSQVNE